MAGEECMFCLQKPAEVRATAEETGSEEARVCARCWKLLKDPRTGLPMLRGHVTLTLRRSGEENLDQKVQAFMDAVKDLKPRS